MELVPYEDQRHRDACLALFDSHLGGLFRPEERTGFKAFLDHLPGVYLVGEADGDVVACGGIAFEDEAHTLASVCWTIVHRDHLGEGLGREITNASVQRAMGDARCTAVRLETIPATRGFFEKLGFEVVETEADGYGPGLDRVEMRRSVP